MRKGNGITLIALTITIIVLLLLAGVALSMAMGENNIFKTTENAVEQNNKAQVKEKIELAIMEKQLEEKREVSLDEIIDKLIEKGITSESNSDREIGTVITEEGYVATIKEKEEGGWEVIIGEKGTARIKLNISKTPEILTSKVTIKIEGRLIGIGLKELQMPDGSKEEYEEGITKIEETYEVTANGTYKFVLIGRDEQEIEKEITINNIVEGIITILPSTTEWTKDNIIVEVIYPEGTEELIREISIDNGVTWKEYKEGVEISENTTIQARLKNTEEIIKTATLIINKIDKTAPTAPTIAGGSTEYATSRTITISKEAEDKGSGISYYEYYLSNNSTKPEKESTATGKIGNTAEEKSKVFNTNYAGYYIYVRGVDKVGNIGEWSEAERLYIDINKPTVTASETTTITQGDNNAISGYFTINKNGNAEIASILYQDTCHNNISITNTSTLTTGTHTITCTVTKSTGLSASITKTIIVNVKKPAYTEEFYAPSKTGHETATITGTFTVPEGVTRIRVAVVGGGGGSSSNGTNIGEDSFFGSVRATGGTNSSAGSPNGYYTNKVGFTRSFTMTRQSLSTEFGDKNTLKEFGWPYSAYTGGYNSTYITVTPGQVINWQAGRGAHKAGVGYVLIAYGGDI